MFRIIRFILLLTSSAVPAALVHASDIPHFDDAMEPHQLAVRLVETMTDREALGQVLMFGYPDESPDENILRWIREEGLGGVKVFGWNAGNLSNLAETVGVYQDEAVSPEA